MLRVKLGHLDAWNEGRRRAAAHYRAAIADAGLEEAVRCPPGDGDAHPVYHLFCVRVSKRDQLRGHLTSQGIGCAVYYPVPVHLQPCWRPLGYSEGDFPVAEQACREILALPCWPGLPESDIERVVQAIAAFY